MLTARRRAAHRRSTIVLALMVALAACGKKSTSAADQAAAAEVTGLAAVPMTAEAIISVDVPRVVASPLIARAVDQLLVRDPELAASWQRLRGACKLDPVNQVKHVTLALGRKTGDAGNGPVLLVATGAIVEADLVACVRAMVGNGRGDLTAKAAGARTMYVAKDGNRTMFFAFGRADTVILGSNEAYVTEAVGTGKKVLDNPEMAKWIGMADQKAPIWGAGRIDPAIGKGLIKATGGAVTAGPAAIITALDAGSGATVELGAVMATPADANALESFAKQQIGLLGYAAQAKGLGKLVDKIAVSSATSSDGAVVHFKLALTLDEVNQLLSVLDGGGAPPQDAGP